MKTGLVRQPAAIDDRRFAGYFRPSPFQPAPIEAQSVDGRSFYVEPGYTMLRKPDGSGQMYGKMMIDMRTGDIWGFPRLVEGPISG